MVGFLGFVAADLFRVFAAVIEMNPSNGDKSTKQDDATSVSNDQNQVDSSKYTGSINKDKVGFTPPPILKSILKNVARKTQPVTNEVRIGLVWFRFGLGCLRAVGYVFVVSVFVTGFGQISDAESTRLSAMELCMRVFKGWNWTSNGSFCSSGSRIILGWNVDAVDLNVVAMNDQAVQQWLGRHRWDTKGGTTEVVQRLGHYSWDVIGGTPEAGQQWLGRHRWDTRGGTTEVVQHGYNNSNTPLPPVPTSSPPPHQLQLCNH
ncbi:hypothetical protein CTI12_AA202180 [Artemisia annua]|uniref:Uncharacterized protein n=1 Tax=Artemisia annua TaxID=35608 RepID=A0A2U1P1Z6_ARTAN|nr:hypothetical protein CTI12_AA202180 [Artemisia annua]